MEEAVGRVFDSLEKGEMITVHGDYDADGVTGSVVLMSTLIDICRKMPEGKGVYDEKQCSVFLPDREKDGYGYSPKTAEYFAEERKTKLVITVDCGISNRPAVLRGKELGIDTIICDHHTIPDDIPYEAIIIHPKMENEIYPNKHLCGCAVGFKLATMLFREAKKRGADIQDGYEKWLLDLVAIATVADVVSMTGENRVLEKYGLLVLNKTKRLGLKKIIEVAGSKGVFDTTTIGFQISPRINAAGRMGDAKLAYDVLMAEDEMEAVKLANQLDQVNRDRQKASGLVYEEAKEVIGEVTDQKLLVAVKEGWSQGLVGLVAGKLISDFQLPVFVATQKEEHFHGSGRSIEQFDVTKALQYAGEFLDKFGGHPQACGFSTSGVERFDKAVSLMMEYAQIELGEKDLSATLPIDAELEIKSIDWEFHHKLSHFEPYGPGNRSPVFTSSQVEVTRLSVVGKEGAHLKLSIKQKDSPTFNMIGFRKGDLMSKMRIGDKIDITYEIDVNEWNGLKTLQLKIVDIKL